MAPDDIRFGLLKEDRGWFFVEYSPPMANYRFSLLQLSVVEERDAQAVASAMESEAKEWLRRYPVPVMATAFSADGSVFSLKGVRPIDNLIAWLDTEESQPVLRWELVKDDVLTSSGTDGPQASHFLLCLSQPAVHYHVCAGHGT